MEILPAFQVLDAARRWVGTPFHHQGRRCRVGVDCAGLILGVAEDLGIPMRECTDYGRQPQPATMGRHLCARLTQINPEDLRVGDVMWFRIAKVPQHLAIRSDVGIIHAYQGVKRVVEHGYDHRWQRRLIGVFRYKFSGVR